MVSVQIPWRHVTYTSPIFDFEYPPVSVNFKIQKKNYVVDNSFQHFLLKISIFLTAHEENKIVSTAGTGCRLRTFLATGESII